MFEWNARIIQSTNNNSDLETHTQTHFCCSRGRTFSASKNYSIQAGVRTHQVNLLAFVVAQITLEFNECDHRSSDFYSFSESKRSVRVSLDIIWKIDCSGISNDRNWFELELKNCCSANVNDVARTITSARQSQTVEKKIYSATFIAASQKFPVAVIRQNKLATRRALAPNMFA